MVGHGVRKGRPTVLLGREAPNTGACGDFVAAGPKRGGGLGEDDHEGVV